MIKGIVRDAKRAYLRVKVKGIQGKETEIEAVLDTGFIEYLTLLLEVIDELGLVRVDRTTVVLADGNRASVTYYLGRVLWEGRDLTVYIIASKGEPLMGMSLLNDCHVEIDVKPNGKVIIEPLDEISNGSEQI